MEYTYKKPVDKAELVEVTVPSGNVFLFEKPSKFGMLFSAGQLPVTAANAAVESWQKDGLLDDTTESQTDQLKLVKTVMDLRDKILKLSHTPKLVVGYTERPGELSTDDVTDEDLEYLFKWVSAGGDVSVMLTMFPGGSQPSTLAVASRRKVRRASK
jgi:hypothetical protein